MHFLHYRRTIELYCLYTTKNYFFVTIFGKSIGADSCNNIGNWIFQTENKVNKLIAHTGKHGEFKL